MHQERPPPLHRRVKLQIRQRGAQRIRHCEGSFSYIDFRPKPELDSTCTIVVLWCGNDVIPIPRWEGGDGRTSCVSLTGVRELRRVAHSGEVVTQKQCAKHCFWITTCVENGETLRSSIFDISPPAYTILLFCYILELDPHTSQTCRRTSSARNSGLHRSSQHLVARKRRTSISSVDLLSPVIPSTIIWKRKMTRGGQEVMYERLFFELGSG